MEKVYMACAVVGGTLIVCQFLATLLGVGGHHDMGGGHDMAGDVGGHDMSGHDGGGDAGSAHDASSGHHDAGHHEGERGSASNWFFSLLTLRTLTAAFAFFGLAGLAAIRFDMEPMQGLAIALGAGAAALVGVGYLMRFLYQLNVDGTIRIERALGAPGTVYLSIPGGKSGVGKVQVSQLNRTVEYKAITSHEELATGTKIVVVAIAGADTVEVAAKHSERTTHA